jgi:hypothetical protein
VWISTGGARGRGDGLPEGVVIFCSSLRLGVLSPAKSRFSCSGVEGLCFADALECFDNCECKELVEPRPSGSVPFNGYSFAGTGGECSVGGGAAIEVSTGIGTRRDRCSGYLFSGIREVCTEG